MPAGSPIQMGKTLHIVSAVGTTAIDIGSWQNVEPGQRVTILAAESAVTATLLVELGGLPIGQGAVPLENGTDTLVYPDDVYCSAIVPLGSPVQLLVLTAGGTVAGLRVAVSIE